jgi:hypothetical protein
VAGRQGASASAWAGRGQPSGLDTVEEMMDRDFTFALDLLVAGIEAMVKRG